MYYLNEEHKHYMIEKNKSKTESFMLRKGLYGNLYDLINNNVMIKILQYDFKYETIDFIRSYFNRSLEGIYKMTYKITDMGHDIVRNDIQAKITNGFKFIKTIDMKLHRMYNTVNSAKPLKRIVTTMKRCIGLVGKFHEFFNIAGFLTNYLTKQFYLDKRDNSLNSFDIFKFISDLRKEVVSSFKKVTHKVLSFRNSMIYSHRYKNYTKLRNHGLLHQIVNKKLNAGRVMKEYYKQLNENKRNFVKPTIADKYLQPIRTRKNYIYKRYKKKTKYFCFIPYNTCLSK